MSDDVSRRVRDVVAATFGVPAEALTPESGDQTIEAWDSMNQIHLIVALEGEFAISLEPEDAVALTTVAAIEHAVRSLIPHV